MAGELAPIGTFLNSILGNVSTPQYLARYMVNARRLGATRRARVISDCTISTTLLAVLPTLTITLNYGSSSISLTGVQLLTLGLVIVNRPFQIIATVTATESPTAQWGTIAVTSQQSGSYMATPYYNGGQMNTNSMASNELSITITYSSVITGATITITPRTRVQEIVG